MEYATPADVFETIKQGLISPPATASLAEISETLSMSIPEFTTLMKNFATSNNVITINTEMHGFENNVPLVSKLNEWKVMTSDNGNYADGHGEEDGNLEIFDGDNSLPEMDIDSILNDLIEMFKTEQGREPTDDEVKQWIETIKESMEEGGE